jgi:CspA family cold shock protein
MYKGIIKSIERSKGFGFIETDEEDRIFFHQRWLRKVRFKDLHEGVEVVFQIKQGPRGPRATNLNLRENAEEPGSTSHPEEIFKE